MISRARLLPVLFGGGAVSIGAALKTSMISWWTMNEASTGVGAVTRNDSHGTNHLTDVNTTASAAGKISNAADFEKDNSERLTVADNDSLSMGDIDFTICAWVKFEAPAQANNSWGTILAKWDFSTNNREYALAWERADASSINHIRLEVSSNGTAITGLSASTLGLPATGTWYFVVMWHDAAANTLNIQVNDGAVDSVAYTSGVHSGNSTLFFGSLNATAGYYLDGLGDEAALWKRTLTAAERTWLYNAGAGRTYTDLI